jgi:hypothetical protein
MKQVKIITPPEVTYSKTITALSIEIDGVVYEVGEEQDNNGAKLLFDDGVSAEVRGIAEALFSNDDYIDSAFCEELVGGEVFDIDYEGQIS